jgi:hypothetical protein
MYQMCTGQGDIKLHYNYQYSDVNLKTVTPIWVNFIINLGEKK